MSTQEMPNKESPVLHIDGEMAIYRVADLKQRVLAALDATQVLEVNLSAVTELDTAGVQLLILAKKVALAGGKELRMVAHSQPVLEVFEMLNLVSYFGDPLVMSRDDPLESARISSRPLTGSSHES
jgi:anti-anti-sigma factor